MGHETFPSCSSSVELSANSHLNDWSVSARISEQTVNSTFSDSAVIFATNNLVPISKSCLSCSCMLLKFASETPQDLVSMGHSGNTYHPRWSGRIEQNDGNVTKVLPKFTVTRSLNENDSEGHYWWRC